MDDYDSDDDVANLEVLSWTTYWIVGCSTVGGLLFGYDTGLVSGLLVLIGDDLGGQPLTRNEKEAVTAVTSALALLGAVAAGGLADRFGRRPAIGISCAVFVAAAACMALSSSVASMLVGRATVGLAVGVASTTVPVYIAEVAPSRYRGRLVTLNSVATTGGQVVAYLTGVVCSHIPHGWRVLVGVSAAPALFFLGAMAFLPESPRFLLHAGHPERAERALSALYPHLDAAALHRLLVLQGGEAVEDHEPLMASSSRRHALQMQSKTTRATWNASTIRALVVACGVMAAQQLCGFNSLMYYSATVFADLGFADPVAASLVVALTNFAFTFVAVKYVDQVGRRDMLIYTMPMASLALAGLALTFALDPVPVQAVLALTLCFVGSYSSALGNVPWQGVELLPLGARALGSTAITVTNWSCNFVISATFLTLLETISAPGVFFGYAVITLGSSIGVYYCYPDVSGMTLEAIEGVFDKGWLVGPRH